MIPQQPEHTEPTNWRKSQRAKLIADRLAVSESERKQLASEVAYVLDSLINAASNPTVSLYWPFRGELNLRHWMHAAYMRGVTIALPVVVTKAQPMVFREWTPQCEMEKGIWNIPVLSGTATVYLVRATNHAVAS